MRSIGFLWQIMTSQLSLWKGGSVGSGHIILVVQDGGDDRVL
jgi:hypothetical protein